MQNNLVQKLYWYFGVVMVLLIFSMGVGLLATDAMYDAIPKPRRTWLAIVFLIYSIFRGGRVYMQYKQFKSKSDE
ncbi:MAG TPA: hypothetical protein VJI69_09145 [Bacteroidia bacterium]|nr:hypothetical protein [Bacteroidia bacterium]